MEEFLQVPHVLAYVDKVEIGIAGEFRLDKVTIRAAWHYVNFGHSGIQNATHIDGCILGKDTQISPSINLWLRNRWAENLLYYRF